MSEMDEQQQWEHEQQLYEENLPDVNLGDLPQLYSDGVVPFRKRDLVLVKVDGHPPWPGVIGGGRGRGRMIRKARRKSDITFKVYLPYLNIERYVPIARIQKYYPEAANSVAFVHGSPESNYYNSYIQAAFAAALSSGAPIQNDPDNPFQDNQILDEWNPDTPSNQLDAISRANEVFEYYVANPNGDGAPETAFGEDIKVGMPRHHPYFVDGEAVPEPDAPAINILNEETETAENERVEGTFKRNCLKFYKRYENDLETLRGSWHWDAMRRQKMFTSIT